MEKGRILYDAFTNYYDKGMQALKDQQLNKAKRNFLLASETVLKLAKESGGNIKIQRLKRAEDLLFLAQQIEQRQETGESLLKASNDLLNFQSQSNNFESKNHAQTDEGNNNFNPVSATDVKLDDVAGLEDVKLEIERLITGPQKHPEIYERFKKKRGGGILLYGVPGTGKTMIAQAIANELNAKFFSVKSSDIASKWFGDSEQNIKALFTEARKYPSSIIFFDEFEALGTKRDTHSTVMKRLVPELLSQMQGFEKHKNTLLVVAATNRPWDIDTAFLRPGRFNTSIYVPLPDKDARRAIIEKQLLGIPIRDLNIDVVVNATEGFNGSDVVEFCDKMKDRAIERSIELGQESPINEQDFVTTSSRVKSSVRFEDLQKIAKYEQKFLHKGV